MMLRRNAWGRPPSRVERFVYRVGQTFAAIAWAAVGLAVLLVFGGIAWVELTGR